MFEEHPSAAKGLAWRTSDCDCDRREVSRRPYGAWVIYFVLSLDFGRGGTRPSSWASLLQSLRDGYGGIALLAASSHADTKVGAVLFDISARLTRGSPRALSK